MKRIILILIIGIIISLVSFVSIAEVTYETYDEGVYLKAGDCQTLLVEIEDLPRGNGLAYTIAISCTEDDVFTGIYNRVSDYGRSGIISEVSITPSTRTITGTIHQTFGNLNPDFEKFTLKFEFNDDNYEEFTGKWISASGDSGQWNGTSL